MDSATIYFSIGFDACAMIIVAVIMVNYYTIKRIYTRTEKLFQLLMGTLLLSALLNMAYVSAYAFNLGERIPALYYFIVMLMVIGTHSVGIFFMLYVVSECYENRPLPRNFMYIAVGIIGAIGAAVAVYGCLFGMGLDTSALLVILYAEHYAALALSAAYVFVNRKIISRRKQANIILFIAFNVLATILQFIVQAQVTAFAEAVAVMLIYATLRNPKDVIDPLTHQFNMQAFKDFARRFIASRRKFILFITNFRNYGAITAIWGQRAEELICEKARRLKGAVKKSIYVYRLADARFAIMFSGEAEFEEFRQKYLELLKQPYKIGETVVPAENIAMAIRFPEVASKYNDIESIIKFYRDNYGGNEPVYEASREAIEQVERREKVDYAIQRAIRLHSFQVYYQPIYDLKAKKFTCCEALVRLKDDELGFIPPDEFIPQAEQNGTIIEVGRQVVEEVCSFVKHCKPETLGIDFIDVNLSIIQCLQPDVIEDIKGILKDYDVPRGMVNLEITETASAKSYAILQQRLDELHSNGFTISLDDFGTGFSSVEFLINFPFDIVKLDRSLVWAYMKEDKYEPILQHYMPMLHSLGTKIVAEGVETQEMVKALDGLGCDYLQGYYYSRPMPKEDFINFLKERQTPSAEN